MAKIGRLMGLSEGMVSRRCRILRYKPPNPVALRGAAKRSAERSAT